MCGFWSHVIKGPTDERNNQQVGVQFHLSTSGDPVLAVLFAKEAVFPPLGLLCPLVKYEVAEIACAQVWIFNFVPLIYLSVFVPVPGFLFLLLLQ